MCKCMCAWLSLNYSRTMRQQNLKLIDCVCWKITIPPKDEKPPMLDKFETCVA